ncbi:MAG: hypothetical protein V1844_12700 [Pseudomonadota bacterium]
MTAIEFFIEHLGAILAAFQETESSKAAWESLKGIMPEIEQSMSFPTFRQYGGLLVALNSRLNIPYLQERLKELSTIEQELEAVKQELNRLQGLNTELNKQIESIGTELSKQFVLNIDLNNELQLNSKLNKEHGLNMPVKQETVKQGLNISGWTVAESGGYFRAFRKMGGKMKAVYLGKNLEGAEQKIHAKQGQLSGSDPG